MSAPIKAGGSGVAGFRLYSVDTNNYGNGDNSFTKTLTVADPLDMDRDLILPMHAFDNMLPVNDSDTSSEWAIEGVQIRKLTANTVEVHGFQDSQADNNDTYRITFMAIRMRGKVYEYQTTADSSGGTQGRVIQNIATTHAEGSPVFLQGYGGGIRNGTTLRATCCAPLSKIKADGSWDLDISRGNNTGGTFPLWYAVVE